MTDYRDDEAFALGADADDPLASFAERFHVPADGDVLYFAGNSLGLQPKAAEERLAGELEDWRRLAVDAHFKGRRPWYRYHEQFRGPLARLVGAGEDEVVIMNGLTVNLHLMMVTFYRPTAGRSKILIDPFAFPSDTYAARSQIAFHGYDPDSDLLVPHPREGEHLVRTEDLLELIERRGDEIALAMMSGVNYYTGQLYDLEAITGAARRRGAVVGWDLAHAAGNVPLRLHDWEVDFACWCSYKYLNGGPGAPGACFVHRRHAANTSLPRFAGWWGNDPDTRFRMHLQSEFVPVASADAWQLSNPPILALAPLLASVELFDEAGIEALRRKSVALTGYLEFLLERKVGERVEILTPGDPAQRGCQLSLRIPQDPDALFASLEREGIVGDLRRPDVIRIAPVPLYNRFHEVWRLVEVLAAHA